MGDVVTKLKFSDGEGGGGASSVAQFYIEVCDNGYILKVIDVDGLEYTYVEHDIDECLKLIKELV